MGVEDPPPLHPPSQMGEQAAALLPAKCHTKRVNSLNRNDIPKEYAGCPCFHHLLYYKTLTTR